MVRLAAARAQGNAGGRPAVMDPGKLAAARAHRERGENPAQIGKAPGVSRASVCRRFGAASQETWASRAQSSDSQPARDPSRAASPFLPGLPRVPVFPAAYDALALAVLPSRTR
jgi:hypothetical protein